MNITAQLRAWDTQQSQLLACNQCTHGVSVGYNRYCKQRRPNAPEPVERCRSDKGFCGPEAKFLDIESHRMLGFPAGFTTRGA